MIIRKQNYKVSVIFKMLHYYIQIVAALLKSKKPSFN